MSRSTQHDQCISRSRRTRTEFRSTKDDVVGLSWREERDLRRAMYDSLRRVRQEQQRHRQPNAVSKPPEAGITSQRKLRSFSNLQSDNGNSSSNSANRAVIGDERLSSMQFPKSPIHQKPFLPPVKDTKGRECTPSGASTNVIRGRRPVPRPPSRIPPTSSSSRLLQLSKKLKAKAARRTASVGVRPLSRRPRSRVRRYLAELPTSKNSSPTCNSGLVYAHDHLEDNLETRVTVSGAASKNNSPSCPCHPWSSVRLHSSAPKCDALETTVRLDDSPRTTQPSHSLPSDTISPALWQDSEGNPVDTHDFVDFLCYYGTPCLSEKLAWFSTAPHLRICASNAKLPPTEPIRKSVNHLHPGRQPNNSAPITPPRPHLTDLVCEGQGDKPFRDINPARAFPLYRPVLVARKTASAYSNGLLLNLPNSNSTVLETSFNGPLVSMSVCTRNSATSSLSTIVNKSRLSSTARRHLVSAARPRKSAVPLRTSRGLRRAPAARPASTILRIAGVQTRSHAPL